MTILRQYKRITIPKHKQLQNRGDKDIKNKTGIRRQKGEEGMTAPHHQYWNPYLAGILAGLVLTCSVWATGKFFGTSTTFVRSAGMIEKAYSPERVAALDYFKKEKPIVDWQWMFVVGIFFGASLAAKLSGTYKLELVPERWRDRFGQHIGKRGAVAFVGGVIAMIGARLADGCPSGHGLSGGAQLSVGSFIALICFFIGGIITVRILYKGGNAP